MPKLTVVISPLHSLTPAQARSGIRSWCKRLFTTTISRKISPDRAIPELIGRHDTARPENFGHVTTVPPRSSHYQDGFFIGNWNTHHGSRINHAQRQLKIREAVTPRADSLHSCAGLPASIPAFLATLLKTSDVRIVDHTHVATGHVLGMGEPVIAAQSQRATWFVGRRRLFGISIRGCWQ